MASWFKWQSLKKFLQCYGPKPVQYEPTFGIQDLIATAVICALLWFVLIFSGAITGNTFLIGMP